MLHFLLFMIFKDIHSSEKSQNERQISELLENFLDQAVHEFLPALAFSGKDVQLFSLQEPFVLLLLRH